MDHRADPDRFFPPEGVFTALICGASSTIHTLRTAFPKFLFPSFAITLVIYSKNRIGTISYMRAKLAVSRSVRSPSLRINT